MKQRIITLHADNSNQEEWISSVRTEQRMNNIMHLAVKSMSVHRCLKTADLIASAEASGKAASSKDASSIKAEAEQEGEDGEEAKEANEKPEDMLQAAVVKKESDVPASEHGLLDLTDLDDYENLFMDKVRVFLDIQGKPENKIQSKKRFDLSNQLVLSAPHHKHKLRTWIEGDIYGFIKLVTIDVRKTGRTLFNEVSALGAVQFRQGDRIDDVINRLYNIQTRTNTLAPNKICEEMMRGAFLTCCSKHADFKQLAMDFQRKPASSPWTKFKMRCANTKVTPNAEKGPQHTRKGERCRRKKQTQVTRRTAQWQSSRR